MKLLIVMPGGTEWLLLFFPVMIVVQIFYLLTLQSTLAAVAPERRQMPPGNVWLLLIPLFSIVWNFIVVNKLADSIRAEANANGIHIKEPRPGYSIGLAMCISNCLYVVPVLNYFAVVAGLVCWIIYWTKIQSYKKALVSGKQISLDYNVER